jgi:hypothetical protein
VLLDVGDGHADDPTTFQKVVPPPESVICL